MEMGALGVMRSVIKNTKIIACVCLVFSACEHPGLGRARRRLPLLPLPEDGCRRQGGRAARCAVSGAIQGWVRVSVQGWVQGWLQVSVQGWVHVSVQGWVLTVQGWVLTVQGWVLTVQGWILTVQGLILTVQGWIFTVQGLILTVQGWILTVQGLILTVQGWVLTVQGWILTVQGWTQGPGLLSHSLIPCDVFVSGQEVRTRRQNEDHTISGGWSFLALCIPKRDSWSSLLQDPQSWTPPERFWHVLPFPLYRTLEIDHDYINTAKTGILGLVSLAFATPDSLKGAQGGGVGPGCNQGT